MPNQCQAAELRVPSAIFWLAPTIEEYSGHSERFMELSPSDADVAIRIPSTGRIAKVLGSP